MKREDSSGRKSASGRVPVRRLALGAAQVALLFFLVGADCANKQVRTYLQGALTVGIEPEVSVRVSGQATPLRPAGAAVRNVLVQRLSTNGPRWVTVKWTPPRGATAVSFPGIQPVNPPGPAPYEFPDVPVSDAGDPLAVPGLVVAYTAPAPPQPLGAQTVVDVFTAQTANGKRYSASFVDPMNGGGAAASAPAAAPAGADGDVGAAASGAYSWRSVTQTVVPVSNVPLDQTLCQNWAGLLQSGSFFVALRFPAQAAGGSAALPLVFDPANSMPRVELQSTDSAPASIFALRLELDPDRLGFAENNLPAAPGERWLTLAPRTQPTVTCPGGLAGGWALHADLDLDLGGATTSCADCTLQEYLCWEGDAPPFVFPAAALSAATAYRGAGTTCAGPVALRLVGEPPSPPLTVEGSNLARYGGFALVKFAHVLRGWMTEDRGAAAELTATSAQGFPWQLYADSSLTQPITAPVAISGSAQFNFWASARLPFGYEGQDTVTITATPTEPGAAPIWVTDNVWVGSWSAPPHDPELHVEAASVPSGGAVSVSGALPDGHYRLVVVPNGAWLPGACYSGPERASVEVDVVDGTLPPTVVWPTAVAGGYDVLALSGSCAAPGVAGLAAADTRIVTGDGLQAAAAVSVQYGLARHLRH